MSTLRVIHLGWNYRVRSVTLLILRFDNIFMRDDIRFTVDSEAEQDQVKTIQPAKRMMMYALVAPLLLTFIIIVFVLSQSFRRDATPIHAKPTSHHLFLILIDGIRYDYIDRDLDHLPGFKRLLDEGVFVPD